ncbi:MAG TPA: hypothetical protein VK501_12845 [Baekduia sp.]|uniref:hypothetical protein n=1 Tax=Baekduia sp. TaxID=2600305 RepID=UPI002CDFD6D8|nr:hypothetical protein [Baekduia sp.]HMJ34793.1 hypothetical protein [Baekduia sp.]
MSVTELDPLFGILHANGAAAAPAEPPPPPATVPEPAAAIVADPGDETVTPSAPELEHPEAAPQHDPDLQPADLEDDPLAVDHEGEDLGGFDAVTDSEPDFEDDEPAATVEVVYDEEPEQLELPAPAAGGVFAAFTPEIPQPRPAPAAAAAPVTQPAADQPRKDGGPLKLRPPSLGALRPAIGRLAARGHRPKKRMIIVLVLLALVVIAAAMGPSKTPAPSASKPAAAVPAARAGTPSKPAAPKAGKSAARRTHRAASPQRTRRARTRVRTRVVIRRVAVPAPAATGAPATALAPRAAPLRRSSAASEFRP